MTKERCDLLRQTAAWVRVEFAGQATPEGRAELEAEADNCAWAADEIERLRAALLEIAKDLRGPGVMDDWNCEQLAVACEKAALPSSSVEPNEQQK